MFDSITIIGVMAILLLFFAMIFIIAATSIRIVSPYQKGVVERLGRYHHTAQPGLNFVIPFVDTLRKVDMREQVVDVQPQEVITKDNVVVTVDAIVYYEATDPIKLTYNVADFYSAATKLAQTNLRNVIGETELDEALTSREVINLKLRTVLDDATDKWGVRVVRVEIKRIDPPADVTAAMHRQMKAERRSAPTSWRPRASASRAFSTPKVRLRPSSVSPMPSAIGSRWKPRARRMPSILSTRRSSAPIPTTG